MDAMVSVLYSGPKFVYGDDISLLLLLYLLYLITGFLFPGTSLDPVLHPITQASFSDCSTFLITCDVPSSTAVFCRKCTDRFPSFVSRYF
jgi:hypothetical protein